jgi:integrase
VTVDRRPMGSGSIESRNGRHRVRLRVGGKKQTLGTYPTLERAQAVLSAALEQLEGTVSGSVTLRGWVATWLEQRAEGQEVRSTTGDASRLRTHVLSESWADDPIETISRPMVQAWARELLTRPAKRYVGGAALQDAPVLAELGRSLSRTTAGHALRALRVCFRDALEAGLITENPCVGVRLPRVARLEDPSTYLTTEEIHALLGCEAVPVERRRIFWVAIFTGLRKGELWGLRWGDVDLEAGRLAVRRSYRAAPKNGKHRYVPLLPPARAALEALRPERPAPDALVFPDARGGMRRPYDSAGFAEALEAAGLRHVRFHDLRHTCASHLRMGTWRPPLSPSELQLWMGHSSVAMVERYAHLAPDYLTGPTLDPNRSHLRELNPRPTVYETLGNGRNTAQSLEFVKNGATEGPMRAHAVETLERAARGEPVPRCAVELAIGVLDALAAHPGAARAVRGRG